jgi:DNA polymerase-3 subunit gamma/tau
MLGAGGSEEVAAFVDELLARDMAAGLRRINAALEEGLDLRQFNRQVVDHLRGLMLVKSGAAAVEGSLLEVTDEMRQRMQKQAEAVGLPELLRWVRLFGDADASLRSTAYGQLPLEMAFVAAALKPEEAAAPQQVAVDRKAELAEAVERVGELPAQRAPRREASDAPSRAAALPPPIHTELGSAMGNGARPDSPAQDTMPRQPGPIEVAEIPEETGELEAAAPDPSTAAAPAKASAPQAGPPATQKLPPDDLPRLVASWNAFVDQINARSPKMAAMFEDRELVRPVAVTNAVCILSFRWPLHAKSSMSDTPHPRRTVIETALSRVLGYPCRLQSITFEQEESGVMDGGEPPSGSENSRKGKRDRPAPHETPMGKAALNIFGIDKFDET